MRRKKNLLLTFDYELFLGKQSGNVTDCMIRPTKDVCTIMERYGMKGIFFVDATHLVQLKKLSGQHPECIKDLEIISEQITQLIGAGHYVMPHIHPHWIDSVYLKDQHEFDLENSSHYRFHNLTETQRYEVFSSSMDILNSLIQSVYPDYRMGGFRAGGWSVQPIIDFVPMFKAFGIEFDFSVVTGLYQFSQSQEFDFSNVPSKPVYRFSDDVTLEERDGSFTEIAGSVIRIPAITYNLNRVWMKVTDLLKLDHAYADGTGQYARMKPERQPASIIGINAFSQTHEVASIEKFTTVKLPLYLQHLDKTGYLHLISHPKMLTRFNLIELERFLAKSTKSWEVESDYRIIADSYLRTNT